MRIVSTRKVELVEQLHGKAVADPYRWLEDGEAPEVRAWTDAQNAVTRAAINAIPGGDGLRAEIRKLLEIGYCSTPEIRTMKSGVCRYFHMRREGAQNQGVLYVRDGVDGTSRVLLDAATLSADGTTALDWWYPSSDGALVAWGKSESGSEESTLYVRDVETGKDLPDRIPYTMHASVAWLPDGSGFYYSRYPAPGSVPPGDEQYFARLFVHRLGADSASDRLIFGADREKTDIPSVSISPGGRWLVARVHMGWDRSEIYVRDRSKGEDALWVPVATGAHALFEPTPRDDRLYVTTNDGAPRYRLYTVDYEAPARERWTEVIPEQPDVLDDVTVIGDTIVATYMHEASTRIERYAKDGTSLGSIPLPALGSAGVSGAWNGDEAFVNYTSFVAPYEVTRFDLHTGTTSPWDRVGAAFSPPDVDVSLLHATSKDGTRVPIFVIQKKGAHHEGKTPTVLYGYGGFNVNQTPAFSTRALLTVERGGVWAIAVLRGGGEFGESWHRAGMREKKQNVFDDFIACAEELVARKITSPDHLAIMGGSNGGLLTAAVALQRPALFRVALALVPLTDMLRYHLFRIGKLWIPEYGSADEADDFAFLRAYSPYHNVVDGTRYPAMLLATAESDSRVDPMHARKMAARMQEAQGVSERPILLRVESKAGHGQGKPVTKMVAELADELLFTFQAIGIR